MNTAREIAKTHRLLRRAERQLADLLHADDGPPFSVAEAAAVIGVSSQKLRYEIVSGELEAVKVPYRRPRSLNQGGQSFAYKIPFRSFVRYLRAMRVLPPAA